MHSAPSNGRMPWLAVVFSLLCPGLGHVYCGHITLGMTLLLVTLLFTPLVVFVGLGGPSTGLLVVLLVLPLAMIVVYGYAVIDSYRSARRLRSSYELRDCNQAFLYALLICVGVIYPAGSTALLRPQVLEAFYIPAKSMIPNIVHGDRVLVNKMAYGSHGPQRGDVIVFRAGQRQQHYVKRVMALAGDTVAVRDNDVYVNGTRLKREPNGATEGDRGSAAGSVFHETNDGRCYLVRSDTSPETVGSFPEIRVPEDHVFVMGDHRSVSRDSREFGPVPLGDVSGPVQYIYYPAKTWRRFGTL